MVLLFIVLIFIDWRGFDNCLITMQGQRALDFVLRNQGLIDKTLLFDIELVNIAEN